MSLPAEGSVWWINCRRCDDMVLAVYVDGLQSVLSRRSVPYNDARVLGRYSRCLWHVWRSAAGLLAAAWFPSEGRPERGRLYLQHDCDIRR